MKSVAIGTIRIYQRVSGALIAQGTAFSGCRSWPTCSEWTIQAVERDGVFAGLLKGIMRVLRCNPLFHPQLP